jgi:carnitine 3-dehydrogenase
MSFAEKRTDNVALLGLGTVGLGWAANYLAKGFTVRAFDPTSGSAAKADHFLKAAWPSLRALGLTDLAEYPSHRLIIVDTTAEAARDAAYVHENGPEDVSVKRTILAAAEDAARPDTIFASSSGGLPPSTLQSEMHHPERFLIAHPFNPPHIVPLIEVLGGEKTAPRYVDQMLSHLRSLGKHPIKLDREMPGYLTNRLQFALLREAINCLVEGVASAESIEDAVTYGLAPRWMVMGSLTTLTLAGGDGGMPRVLDSFAGAIEGWWNALGKPTMTPDVKTALLKAAEKLTSGKSIKDVAGMRDRNLVSILQSASKLETGRR